MLTRGDTLSLPLDFHQDITSAKIKMQAYEQGSLTPIISKEISEHYLPEEGKTILLVESEKTNIPAGEYRMDIQITLGSGNVYTFYPATPDIQAKLIITEQVTE